MRQHVQQFVSQCQVCQQMKTSSLLPAGLLQPLPIPELVFECISMDFITGLPFSHGKTIIMVVVDRLTKYGHFIALPTAFNSTTVATIFVTEIVRLHGIPADIVSDRDPRFLSDFWKELHKMQGTQLSFSTAYHPQSDGQTESLNKCLEMYLRCFVTDQPTAWVRLLPWAEYWYNTSYHTAAKMTPFEALYGRPPPTVSRYVRDNTGNAAVAVQLQERDAVLHKLKNNLLQAQDRMKAASDKHRKDVQLEVGDWVYVKLQPFRQNSVRLQRHSKLGRRYFGPFQVLARIGQVAYRLDLPATATIHIVFHVSLLKKCTGIPDQQITPLHLVDSSAQLILKPLQILDTRTVRRSDLVIDQVLIQWEGLPKQAATWEDKIQSLRSFPNLHLEDKVKLKGDGNVMKEKILQPNSKEMMSPEEERGQPKLRRSNRAKKVSSKMEDYVCQATSANDN
ncbi:hypothetical protein E3N88_08869 [Mikania micrantha]|uniref:Integrase catalytic domain-containing protein n=1 Tax=Mikania micrantha TaxID=192012 RepID=A0A5N6PJR7_9ASTR|nr:hypothetical protein E3N88_08869 [Mikania micrantha]